MKGGRKRTQVDSRRRGKVEKRREQKPREPKNVSSRIRNKARGWKSKPTSPSSTRREGVLKILGERVRCR